jgi:hypothetical protein
VAKGMEYGPYLKYFSKTAGPTESKTRKVLVLKLDP